MPSGNNLWPVCSAAVMQEWDAFTIANEPVSSWHLMERAASKCVGWLLNKFPDAAFTIFCGPGNNGGDGLAIARLLSDASKVVTVSVVNTGSKCSADHLINRNLLHLPVIDVNYKTDLIEISSDHIIIDALFGTGLKNTLSDVYADCVEHINQAQNTVVSIDLPSGLLADLMSDGAIVKASYTLTFQAPKLALLLPSSAQYVGDFYILDIQLHLAFWEQHSALSHLLGRSFIQQLLRQPNRFDHKGSNGHALLVTGAAAKYGAAVMSVKAALRSGVGLLTAHVPAHAEYILQTTCPEAMLSMDVHQDMVTNIPLSAHYTAIGVGPGIGTDEATFKAVYNLLSTTPEKLVLDADAINILSIHPECLSILPENTILTPHVKEFERLVGVCKNPFERHQRQRDFSQKYKVFVILKGAFSCLTTPEGKAYFNSSGNPGMAKGGSGDVLTGVITALMAQQYTIETAALIGMYVHGLAGDLAASQMGKLSMNASDTIEHLPEAFKSLVELPGN